MLPLPLLDNFQCILLHLHHNFGQMLSLHTGNCAHFRVTGSDGACRGTVLVLISSLSGAAFRFYICAQSQVANTTHVKEALRLFKVSTFSAATSSYGDGNSNEVAPARSLETH